MEEKPDAVMKPKVVGFFLFLGWKVALEESKRQHEWYSGTVFLKTDHSNCQLSIDINTNTETLFFKWRLICRK